MPLLGSLFSELGVAAYIDGLLVRCSVISSGSFT
jgi:hypothetical protein